MTIKTVTRFILVLILTALATGAKAEIVRIETAAGPIQVSAAIAPKMQAFIADVVALGFKGRINCFARGGHVRGSRHYSGNACDFAQREWGKTVAVMYRVADLAAKHGLRDGCTFGDCGHIDDGQQLARVRLKQSIYAQHATYNAPDRHQIN